MSYGAWFLVVTSTDSGDARCAAVRVVNCRALHPGQEFICDVVDLAVVQSGAEIGLRRRADPARQVTRDAYGPFADQLMVHGVPIDLTECSDVAVQVNATRLANVWFSETRYDNVPATVVSGSVSFRRAPGDAEWTLHATEPAAAAAPRGPAGAAPLRWMKAPGHVEDRPRPESPDRSMFLIARSSQFAVVTATGWGVIRIEFDSADRKMVCTIWEAAAGMTEMSLDATPSSVARLPPDRQAHVVVAGHLVAVEMGYTGQGDVRFGSGRSGLIRRLRPGDLAIGLADRDALYWRHASESPWVCTRE